MYNMHNWIRGMDPDPAWFRKNLMLLQC